MKPYTSALLLSLAFTSTLAAQTGLREPDATPPKSVVLNGAVDVPLIDPGIPGASLPVINVMVNGKGPFRFGVETGAGFVAVTREFVDALGLKRAGGTDDFPEYVVDSVTFGAASFRGVSVLAMPRAARGVDGLLGLPFFRSVTFTVDYPANRFRVSRDTLPSVNGKDILALSHVGPFWGLPIDLGGKAFTAVLDTRSMAALSITPTGAEPLRFDGELQVVGRSSGAGLPSADVKEGRLTGDAKIGAYTFPHPPLSVRTLPPGFPDGPLVGSRVLRHFVMSLDQRGARVRLTRADASPIDLVGTRDALGSAAQSPAASAPNAGSLDDYAGTYGDRTLSIVDGRLHIQRPNGQLLQLALAGRDAFTLVGIDGAKIEFGRDAAGRVNEIRVLNRQNQWERVPKDR